MPPPPRAEVVVVGAGLAGLSAAVRLQASGCDVQLLEASGSVGGRLHTERIDGFVVDRGFQVLNTGYPRAADLDLDDLELGLFWPGAVFRTDGRVHRVVDPRRHPGTVPGTLRAPLGDLRERSALVRYALRAAYSPVPRLTGAADGSAMDALRAAGVGSAAIEAFLRPFLAGVLLEPDLATSRRYVDLLLRSFVRGATGLPANGMQAIGAQLAGRFDDDRLHLRTPVSSVATGAVTTADGTCRADAVVVATDPATAATLLPGLAAAAPKRVTTHLHVLPASPWPSPMIVLGEPGGHLVNTVVVSDAQPRYSPDGRALIASSTLAPTTEPAVREEIARAHGVPTTELAHLTSVTVDGAQPAALPPFDLRRPVALGGGLYVCGDHRDTPSIQGAMASGVRAARAVLRALRPAAGLPPIPRTEN